MNDKQTRPTPGKDTAAGIWSQLHNRRNGLLRKCERYSELTVRKVCRQDGYDDVGDDQSHDWQSLGAQAVNHVVSKLMIAMFAPSKPFFRVAPGEKTSESAKKANMTETDLGEVLAKMERDGSLTLDSKGQRPKLYQVCRHLVVTGNVLLVLDQDNLRVMGLKYYVVKRNHLGEVHTAVIREDIQFDELDQDIQDQLGKWYKADAKVAHYRLIKKVRNEYTMTQWIEERQLPKEYSKRWTAEKLPYRFLTWDLGDEADYGTGLVEDYAGDFEALSHLSEAMVTGGVVGTEFRWVISPNGMTSIDDFRNSLNGDTMAGAAKDVAAIAPPVAEGVKTAMSVADVYMQRISRGFLLASAVTRNAERVTAEEVRMTAMELESSFGGVYSALAPSIQKPIALWMLDMADYKIAGTDLKLVIITGLDALSRNGDLENFKIGLSTMASLMQAPEGLVARIKWTEVGKFVGQAVGVDMNRFIMTDEEFGKMQQAVMAQQQAQEVGTAGGVAQAEAAAQPEEM